MANRDRHRQGLVYGPVRPSGPRDRGRIVGNLLGLLVVVVTVSVLALAIYFVIQARNSAAPPAPATATASVASPSPSELDLPSAGPSASAIAVVNSTPSPVAVPTSTPPAPPSDPPTTPGPTVFVPPVGTGPGFITFGTTADAQFRVTDPKTTFGIAEPMVWSAYLTRTANSDDLRIRVLKMDPSQPSGQLLVREDVVTPAATDAQIFFRRLRAMGSTAGPGLFTIEYVRGDEVLSQGSFVVQ